MANLARGEKFLWRLLLLLVPVSASPLLPLGAGTLVRPLSLVPALALLLLASFRILVLGQRPRWPQDGGFWLGLFTFYVIAAGLIEIIVIPGNAFKGQTPPDSFVRALATLGIGLVFYVVARLQLRNLKDVGEAVLWLFAGLSASIALAILQVYAIVHGGTALRYVQAATNLIAVRHGELDNRAQGMTLEPSWLATQIILLMLPPLVARIISRQKSIGAPAQRRNIAIALGGLAIALTGLLCAGSRFGLGAAVGMLLLAGCMAVWQGRMAAALAFVALLAVGGGGTIALGSLSAGAGTGYVLGPVGLLLNGSQNIAIDDPEIATAITDALSVAGRAAAGQAAFDLWRDHFWFGVSLGNSYRYFGRYAPDWAFDTGIFTLGRKEGADWLDTGSPEKANPKNFPLRLLAETGLIGALLFGAFFLGQIFSAPAHDPYYKFFRLTAAASILFSGINQDSFADPAVWIVLALCATMGHLQAPRGIASRPPVLSGTVAAT